MVFDYLILKVISLEVMIGLRPGFVAGQAFEAPGQPGHVYSQGHESLPWQNVSFRLPSQRNVNPFASDQLLLS